MGDLNPPLDPALSPASPKPKTVAFAPPSLAAPPPDSSAPSSSSSAVPPPSPSRPQTKRRRSSIKQGSVMPYRPPKELYSHPDPLLRRLRLRNGYAKPVDLQREFADAKVVLFFFGATWPGSSPEPFDVVRQFAARHPHQCKVVYVSIDQTEQAYEQNTRQKPWLAMEWNDGSNTTSSPEGESDTPALPPLEPFLLAGDPDLEEDLHASDPKGELYLRPYSRVHLAEKWNVLGVPNLAVYHPASQKILSYHARFDLLKPGKADPTWEKWSKGEKIQFGAGDLFYALRWSIGAAVLATGYLAAVRSGAIPDLVGNATAALTQQYLAR
ncbi:hypothetical protein JCM10213_001264 [Rhodosporidiobolus nylandii]